VPIDSSRRMSCEVLGRRKRFERADEKDARIRVVAWLRAHEPDIAVDPVILGELRFGILILPKGRKRTALERWFEHGGRPSPLSAWTWTLD